MVHYAVEPKPAEGYQSEAALERSLIQQLMGQGYEYAHIKDEAEFLSCTMMKKSLGRWQAETVKLVPDDGD